MHPEQIKAELRMRGVTPAALADEMDVSTSTMSQVINGRSTSARVSARIAAVIGKPVDAIWPAKKPSLKRSRKPVVAAGAAA